MMEVDFFTAVTPGIAPNAPGFWVPVSGPAVWFEVDTERNRYRSWSTKGSGPWHSDITDFSRNYRPAGPGDKITITF